VASGGKRRRTRTAAVIGTVVGLVVVGGGVAAAWDLLEPAIALTLRTDSPVSGIPLRIIPAVLGSDAVALGAIETARRALVPAGAH